MAYQSLLTNYGKLVHFFDSTEFQLWSMNNPDKKIKDTLDSYKWIAKDYIYDYTND